MKKNILVTANDFGSSKTNPGQSPKHNFFVASACEWNTDNLISWTAPHCPGHALNKLSSFVYSSSYMLYAARRPKIRSSHRQNIKLQQEYFFSWSTMEITSIVLLEVRHYKTFFKGPKSLKTTIFFEWISTRIDLLFVCLFVCFHASRRDAWPLFPAGHTLPA
jgi:hypothetical protein